MNKTSKKLNYALIVGNKKELTSLLLKMEPTDLTDFLRNLQTTKLTRLVKIVDFDQLAELLSRLSPQTSAELLTRVSREQAADVLEEMEPDEAADVLEQTPAPFKSLSLKRMEKKARSEVRKLLDYPQETAGAIMTPRFVAVAADAIIDEALTVVRTLARELESIYYLYVLDDKDRLIGVLSLRALLLADSKAKVAKVMRKDVVTALVSEDQEVAAEKVVDNELTAVPVIDKKGKLLGIITYDDAARVLEKEASEDIERIGGAQPLFFLLLRSALAGSLFCL
jgi:magnesium transporter